MHFSEILAHDKPQDIAETRKLVELAASLGFSCSVAFKALRLGGSERLRQRCLELRTAVELAKVPWIFKAQTYVFFEERYFFQLTFIFSPKSLQMNCFGGSMLLVQLFV